MQLNGVKMVEDHMGVEQQICNCRMLVNVKWKIILYPFWLGLVMCACICFFFSFFIVYSVCSFDHKEACHYIC